MDDLSQQFKEVLFSGSEIVRGVTNYGVVLVFVLGVIISIVIEKMWLRFILKVCLVLGYVVFATFIFLHWWDKLRESALTMNDRFWITQHDGGGLMIPVVQILFYAFLCSIALIIVGFFIRRYKANTANALPPKDLTTNDENQKHIGQFGNNS